jgi:hypothetical protein
VAAGLESTIRRLPAGRTVVLSDTPRFEVVPSICLSDHLDDVGACAQPRATGIDAVRMATERRAARAAGARYLDTSGWTCADACPVVRGNILLYRDDHHMTTEFSIRLAPSLEQELWPSSVTG